MTGSLCRSSQTLHTVMRAASLCLAGLISSGSLLPTTAGAESTVSASGTNSASGTDDGPVSASELGPQRRHVTLEQAQQWVADLSRPEFDVRQHAFRQLLLGGDPCLTAVLQEVQREQAALESRLRCAELLRAWYADGVSPVDLVALESAVERLQSMPGGVGERAHEVWEQQRGPREHRTILRILALGGKVRFEEASFQQAQLELQSPVPAVNFVAIGRQWRGADDGLKLLTRLSQLRTVYYVAQAPISEQGVQFLKDSQFQVELRGAFLGVSSFPAGQDGIPGLQVYAASAGSPAEKAGIQPFDRIIQVDETEITQFKDLIDFLLHKEPGDRVIFRIVRDDQEIEIPVKLGDW
jgi:hypothetical protein